MTAAISVSRSGNQDIDGLLYGTRWNVTELTFSFPTSAAQYGANYPNDEPSEGFSPLNATQQAYVRATLAYYSSLVNLTFVEVSGGSGELRVAESSAPSTAWAYLPTTNPAGGDSWFNPTSYNNPVRGNYAAHTFMHELGHALGLKHGQEAGKFGPVPTAHDSIEYTVMTYRSYVGAPLSGYTYESWGAPQTLMQDDIAALQYLYGANFDSNSGNSVYTWSATTGEMFIDGVGQGAPGGNRIFMTVWDGGGIDTYDFSNYTTNLVVDLQPGAWTTTSSAQIAYLGSGHRAEGNIANALLYEGDLRSLIENATGGSGNDSITGNQVDNVLTGNAGNDTLYGLAGNDDLRGGAGNDVLDGGPGNDILDGGAGADSLSGGDGDDVLMVDAADTLIDGGAGTDTVYLTGNGVIFNLASRHVEIVNGTAGNDLIDGSAEIASPLTINGAGGADTLSGGALGDTLNGGAGDDSLFGNGGDDTINGDAGIDFIRGGDGHDAIDGGDGNDIVFGEAGNDTIVGGAGNEFAFGGAGDDAISGGSGTDYLVGDDNIIGNTGISGRDTLAGGDDNDTLIGGYDSDVLMGDGGNDALYGDFDDVDAMGVNPGSSDRLLGGDGDDFMFGGGGDDWLYGGAGDDTLIGGSGNDVLSGGTGSDAYYGRDGIDLFVFENDWGTDGVWDFEDGSELFDLTAVTGLDFFSQLSIVDRTEGAINFADVAFAGNHIFVVGVSASQLTIADFLL